MSKSHPHPLNTERNHGNKAALEHENTHEKHAGPSARLRRWLSNWSRWLHVYLSMLSFAIVFFFAITGITLNHTEWFAHQQRSNKYEGQIKDDWIAPEQEVAKLEVVEWLRKEYRIKGALSDFITDDYQCTIAFAGPGYSADVFADRETGQFEIVETYSGFAGVINDLHKGRDTGPVWSWVIDISAAFMALVSLSGLILIFFLRKRRSAGILLAVLGVALSYLIYLLFVP